VSLKFEVFWIITPCRLFVTETFRSFKTSENIYQSTRRNNPEDCELQNLLFIKVSKVYNQLHPPFIFCSSRLITQFLINPTHATEGHKWNPRINVSLYIISTKNNDALELKMMACHCRLRCIPSHISQRIISLHYITNREAGKITPKNALSVECDSVNM
jgi:hypothetical protein